MKRCTFCSYRARTLDRLMVVSKYGEKPEYQCRPEFSTECRARQKARLARHVVREATGKNKDTTKNNS